MDRAILREPFIEPERVLMLNPRFGLIVLAVYALMLIAGGVMGYLKARSKASLIAGLVSGGLALGALVISATKNENLGYPLALVLAIAMFIFFAPRAMSSRKFMPMGMMSVASAVVIAVMIWSISVGPGR